MFYVACRAITRLLEVPTCVGGGDGQLQRRRRRTTKQYVKAAVLSHRTMVWPILGNFRGLVATLDQN